MLTEIIIGASVLLQIFTAFLALRLIKTTGWRISWILISSAIFFMAVRRSMTLFRLITEELATPPSLSFEAVGLLTSVLMMAGVWLIAPVFKKMHQGEEEIQRSEAKYRSLVESTEDSIYLIDRDYRYLFINRRHLARLGIEEGGYLGHTYGDHHSLEITKKFQETANRVFETGQSTQLEHRSERDNEFFLLTLSPVKDLAGRTMAVTVVSKKVTHLKKMEEELRALSLTDDLTGLYNRRGFLALADQHFRVAKRLNAKVFMLYADLDDLKMINDTFGHRQGDLALIDVANILKETYRESDIVARIGGDEFVVMPVGDRGDTVLGIISRLEKNLARRTREGGRSIDLSVSVGIAYYDPERPCTVEELLAEGDRLMYQQKKRRKDRISPKS